MHSSVKRNDKTRIVEVLFFNVFNKPRLSPLPLSHFTKMELHSLETKSLPAMIAKNGFNRHTSRKVLYGPTRLTSGGPDSIFFKHWTSTPTLGVAQRIALAWAQMQTGVEWSVFFDVAL
jgi:hypothetical protein